MAMECKFGLTGQNTKDSGIKTRQKERALSGMQKEMYIMENLETIRQMGMVYILM